MQGPTGTTPAATGTSDSTTWLGPYLDHDASLAPTAIGPKSASGTKLREGNQHLTLFEADARRQMRLSSCGDCAPIAPDRAVASAFATCKHGPDAIENDCSSPMG